MTDDIKQGCFENLWIQLRVREEFAPSRWIIKAIRRVNPSALQRVRKPG